MNIEFSRTHEYAAAGWSGGVSGGVTEGKEGDNCAEERRRGGVD